MAKDADDLAKALEAMSAGQAQEPAEPEAHARPAPPPSHQPHEPAQPATPTSPAPAAASAAARAAELKRKTELKRTLIPILLTVGGMLAIAGLASLLAGADALLAVAPAAAWGMLIVGIALLGVAIMNMLQVRDALNQQPA